MAREVKKRVELRPVDDEVAPAVSFVRLENPETRQKPRNEVPVRLGASDDGRVTSRLDVPSRDEVELRTHQPDIDVLIEAAEVAVVPTEDGWGMSAARRHPIPWGWFLLIGLAITGALAWSLKHLKQSEEKAVEIRDNTQSVLASEARDEQEAMELVERIEVVMRKYFTAGSVDLLTGLVRQPERVGPLMREYYSSHPLRANPVQSVRKLQPVTLDNRANLWVASITLDDGTSENLVIEIDPSGNPLIDWETLVCHQPMPWRDFARKRPEGKSMDFRVYVEQDTFFSHEFSDSGRWLCFRLTTLDAEDSVFGYARAGSEEARLILMAIRANGGGRASLILRLGIPERLQSRQGVVIEKVSSIRWIYLDPPESAS